jgi:signal transduction histidine kinase
MRSERLRWRDVRSTTPFRLTLLLGVVFLVALWATLAFSYVLTARELTARTDRILFARAHDLLAASPAQLPGRIRSEIANEAPGISYFALQSRDGDLVVGNIRLPAVGPAASGQPFDAEPRESQYGPVRMLTVRTRSGETIVLGRDISQIRYVRRRLLLILFGSGVFGSALVLASAVLLSLSPLRRVRDLRQASRAIFAGDFARRMPIAGRHDELDQFAGTVNLMLEELARVIAQVKTATDAIAHDLRTPLTRVRAALYRASQSEDSASIAITEQAVSDLDAVIERFAALLRISELEASGRRSGLRQLDPVPLLEEVAELYQPLAEDRGVALSTAFEPVPAIEADGELLFEAISNLVDNATKFAGSRVLLRTGLADGWPVIEVIDDGPGVAIDERDAVIRRFHRSKGAAGVEGTGLGLAVVNAILHLHGFTLELDDAAPGLIARIHTGPAPR